MEFTTVEDFEKKYIARLGDRKLDWNVLKFQEEVDPRYRRAQMRYIGRGATANKDSNVIEANNFTLSTMVLPAGSIGPLHLHSDVEEVFFILEGEMTVLLEHEGKEYEIKMNKRDCVSVPPGIQRGIRNDGDEDAMMLVMLGAAKPQLPTYPEGSELEKIRVERAKEREAIVAQADR
jgi:mannose-6-phosphate isomerase-like protein (cupin superfamily)